MKTKTTFTCHLLFLLCVYLPTAAQNLDFDWVKQFGATGSFVTPLSMGADKQGNIYTLGTFSGTVDFDPSPGTSTLNSVPYYFSGFICKQDSSGGFMWVKRLDDPLHHYTVKDMAVDKQGNTYITGNFVVDTIDIDPGPGVYNVETHYNSRYSTYILKLDANGIFSWATSYGANGLNTVTSIGLDSAQNVYTGGIFGVNLYFFNSDTVVYSLYAPTWYTQVGAVTAYTNVYFCKMDSLGKFVFGTSRYEFKNDTGKVIVSPAGESIMFGSVIDNGFVAKYDITGNLLWSKDLGTPIISASVDQLGFISLVGYFKGLVDFDPGPGIYNMGTPGAAPSLYILQLDGSGNFNWARKIDNLNNAFSQTLNVKNDAERNVYVTGSFKGTVNFDPQGSTPAISSTAGSGFILRYTYYGSVDWVKQIGQNSTSQLNSITLDDFGNLFTGGSFSGTVDFDPDNVVTNLSSSGSSDAFVHKLGYKPLITGIKMQNDDGTVRIFPNPTTDLIYVQVDKSLEKATFKLTDISGQVLQEIRNISGLTFALSLSEQAKGIYVLEISDAKTISRVKVVKN